MPEHRGRTEGFRAGTPLHVGGVTLLPIERVAVHSTRDARWSWVSAAVDPYALIVRDAGGLRALGATAEPVSLQDLREKLPGLDRLLAEIGDSAPRRESGSGGCMGVERRA